MRSLFQALFAGIVFATPLVAQNTTTGAIRGTVTDEGGAPLIATTITATNQETGLNRSTQSDETGVYTVRLLPPGTYRIQARRIGQQPFEVTGVQVIVGTTTTANLQLRQAASVLATQRISAQPPIDVSDGGVRSTVSEAEIDALPARGRDFTDFVETSGLVSPSPETTTGGQFSIAGARPSQTNIQIDGVDANNAFFGENRGGSRIPFSFSLESIREFQIITNGYDVEYGKYSGGLINIVTKGGTNTFKGSVYGNYRGERFTGENFDGTTPNDYNVMQFAAQVEGPIVKDKLHFFGSMDMQHRREPFQSISIGRLVREADDTLVFSRYLTALDTAYGISNARDLYGEWLISNDVLTLFARLDYTMNDRHRLSLRNNFAKHRNENEAGTFAINTGRSQAELNEDTNNSLVGELTSTVKSNMFNVFRVLYSTEERPRVGNELRSELNVNLAGVGTVEYGGAFISYRNSLTENKLQIVDNFTVDLGKHTLKFGTNNTFAHLENTFWLNGSGTFTFNNIDDFEKKLPSRYTRSQRPDLSLPYAEFDAQEYSVYAQDDWQVSPRLRAVLGLRYDVARYGDRPLRVVDVERAFGFKTGIAPIDNNNISPRAALTWDRKGDASEVARMGLGYTYGTVPYVLGGNVAGSVIPMLTLTCSGSIEEGDADAPPEVNYQDFGSQGENVPTQCRGQSSLSGVPEYSFWNRDFAIPETFKANVGYERLITQRTKAGLDLLFSASQKLYTVRNLNLRGTQFTLPGEEGRHVFVPEGQFSPSAAAGNERLRNTDFNNIYVNHNDGIARSVAATFELEHRLGDGNLFNFLSNSLLKGSYTYTWARDNSSFSCCTSNAGYRDQRYGALGPNVIGGLGDKGAGWGSSNFERQHTIIFSGYTTLPYDFKVSGIMRFASGVPWTPETSGDLNGDGERFNDRPFIFAPENLPVFVGNATDTAATRITAEHRLRYSEYLEENECVKKYVGRIIPRNTCRQPWFNKLDISVRKTLRTVNRQSLELSFDFFNVLNGIDKDLGTYRSVSGSNRNLLLPQRYDAIDTDGDGKGIEYEVPKRGTAEFGRVSTLGANLLLQVSAQIGLRYNF